MNEGNCLVIKLPGVINNNNGSIPKINELVFDVINTENYGLALTDRSLYNTSIAENEGQIGVYCRSNNAKAYVCGNGAHFVNANGTGDLGTEISLAANALNILKVNKPAGKDIYYIHITNKNTIYELRIGRTDIFTVDGTGTYSFDTGFDLSQLRSMSNLSNLCLANARYRGCLDLRNTGITNFNDQRCYSYSKNDPIYYAANNYTLACDNFLDILPNSITNLKMSSLPSEIGYLDFDTSHISDLTAFKQIIIGYNINYKQPTTSWLYIDYRGNATTLLNLPMMADVRFYGIKGETANVLRNVNNNYSYGTNSELQNNSLIRHSFYYNIPYINSSKWSQYTSLKTACCTPNGNLLRFNMTNHSAIFTGAVYNSLHYPTVNLSDYTKKSTDKLITISNIILNATYVPNLISQLCNVNEVLPALSENAGDAYYRGISIYTSDTFTPDSTFTSNCKTLHDSKKYCVFVNGTLYK